MMRPSPPRTRPNLLPSFACDSGRPDRHCRQRRALPARQSQAHLPSYHRLAARFGPTA